MRTRIAVLAIALVAGVVAPTPALADGRAYEEEALAACPEGDLHCVLQVEQEMKRRTRALARACDHDVVFALVYTMVTEAYRQTVQHHPDFFSDPSWVNRLGVAFAGFYFGGYDAWHGGSPAPPAWDTGLDAAQRQDVSASGNVVLGVNAHIAQDLPFVLAGIGDLTAEHKRDYDKVNRILRDVYPEAIDEVARRFDPSIRDGDVEGTELDEDALFQSVVAWREEAWRNAERLVAAGTSTLRESTATSVEANAEVRAETFRGQSSYIRPVTGPGTRNAYCESNG